MTSRLRLGVNIDHVATLRNARGEKHPCPVQAAQMAADAGADGITAHLREDRRHIKDRDMERLRAEVHLPLNMEMAATKEMLRFALKLKPHAACLVPEHREELTTEGGLDVVSHLETLRPLIAQLAKAGIRVSLFVDPEPKQIAAAGTTGAHVVELHTGAYAHAWPKTAIHLARLQKAATQAHALGLEVHAGHGLNFNNVGPVAAIPELAELNIGHFLVGEAIYAGLGETVREMRRRMEAARA